MGAGSTVILDGGMGRELQRRGAPFRQPEWSALALSEALPQLPVIGVTVSRSEEDQRPKVQGLAERTADLLGVKLPEHFKVELWDEYFGPRYGEPNAGTLAAVVWAWSFRASWLNSWAGRWVSAANLAKARVSGLKSVAHGSRTCRSSKTRWLRKYPCPLIAPS